MANEVEERLNLNQTTSSGMSPLMEAVLNRYVIENNKTNRKYSQFGQKVSIPKGNTKTISFDKMSPLPKAVTPLTEGVTPKGMAVNITRVKCEPQQYGNYVSYTDQLDFFAHDPSPAILNYTDLLKENQLETFEHIDALTLASGLNVFYAGKVASRANVASGLTIKDVRYAVTSLKRNKVQPATGSDFVAFVHPDVVYDLMTDEEWRQPHTYVDTTELYNGELGKIAGVRFIEDPDAVVFGGDNFGTYPELSIVKIDGTKVYVAEEISATVATATKTRKVYINGKIYTLTNCTAGSNGTAYLTCADFNGANIEVDMKVKPGEGTADGKLVYATIILGKNAFGTSSDDTVQVINKGLGSAGTADPLDQRGTYGWKGYHVCKILEQSKMCRIESLGLTK